MDSYYNRKFYRSRNGIVFGICQGFADWRELPVGMVRFITFLLLVFTGFVPVVLVYLGLAIFLPVEPRGDRGGRRRDDRYDGPGPGEPRRDRERDWDKRFYE